MPQVGSVVKRFIRLAPRRPSRSTPAREQDTVPYPPAARRR